LTVVNTGTVNAETRIYHSYLASISPADPTYSSACTKSHWNSSQNSLWDNSETM